LGQEFDKGDDISYNLLMKQFGNKGNKDIAIKSCNIGLGQGWSG
jgi:hypothetical protein